jgi:hypothetical protein
VLGLLPAGRPAPGRAPPRAIDCFLRLILFKAPAAHAARFAFAPWGARRPAALVAQRRVSRSAVRSFIVLALVRSCFI